MEAYCMKCRAKREMKNAKAIKMKNGKPATQGVCAKCGTKMFRIGKAYKPFKLTLGKQRQLCEAAFASFVYFS